MSRMTDYVLDLESEGLVEHDGTEYKWVDELDRARFEMEYAIDYYNKVMSDRKKTKKKATKL